MKAHIGLALMLSVCLSVCVAAEAPRPSRAETERVAMKVLDDYMVAWNAKDVNAWEATFNFPHYRLASGDMKVLEHAGLQESAKLWGAIDGWHHSGWDKRQVLSWSADKIHVDTRFTRYRADGSKIGTYDSLYVLTNEHGHWGVKLRSSFAQ
jgi:hypothetical protein